MTHLFTHAETSLHSKIRLASYFPYLQNLTCNLPDNQLYHLKERLYEETNMMKMKFASLMYDFQKDLQSNLEVDDLISYLVFYSKGTESVLRDCTSHTQVFRKLVHFVSFFDYDLLEHLIMKFDCSKIKEELKIYVTSFETFSKRLVIECPTDAFGGIEESDKTFVLVSDKIIKDITLEGLKIFKHRINKILGNKLVKILSIEGGSVKITFKTFEDICDLTEEQQRDLRKEGVVSIYFGGQCIDLLKLSKIYYTCSRVPDFY